MAGKATPIKDSASEGQMRKIDLKSQNFGRARSERQIRKENFGGLVRIFFLRGGDISPFDEEAFFSVFS